MRLEHGPVAPVNNLAQVDTAEFEQLRQEIDRVMERQNAERAFINRVIARKAVLVAEFDRLLENLNKPGDDAKQTIANLNAFKGAIEELTRWITGAV